MTEGSFTTVSSVHPELISEWFDRNLPLLPTMVTAFANSKAWWKCSLGHSWKAKISDRTIIGEKCTVCEKEYRSVFPGLAVAYYANQKGLKVQLGSDKLLKTNPRNGKLCLQRKRKGPSIRYPSCMTSPAALPS